jgi:hypothetical protein
LQHSSGTTGWQHLEHGHSGALVVVCSLQHFICSQQAVFENEVKQNNLLIRFPGND